MQALYSIAAILLTSATVHAQVSHGGQPIGWGAPGAHQNSLPAVDFSALDRQAIIAQDSMAQPGVVKYGTQRFQSVDVLGQFQWDPMDDGRRVGRLILRSPGAVMLSLQFDQFDLAPDAMLFIYDQDRKFFIGGFNELNEMPAGGLATAVVPGDVVVIELQEMEDAPCSALHLASITHGYRDIFHFGDQGLLRDYDPGYQSATCHNNVICPVGSAWQEQKRAVAMFLRPDGNGCTGQLVNNTQTLGIPYFYLANHCYTANESQWVFYFNYESPTCIGNVGSTSQTITGGTLKSSYYFDDFVLLQLTSAPPQSYQAFYGGWDRSGSTPTSSTVIHHPLYDVKKITFDNNAATSYTVLPYAGAPETVKCWKSFWDSGIVEPVSSGSALWNQSKRIVGHMYEGAQTCANAGSVFTGCAKFSESWDGTSSTTRLRDWLDPANSSTTLDGYDAGLVPSTINVRVRALLEGSFDSGTNQMAGTLRANGLVPLTEPYSALGYTHVGGGGETTTAGVLSATGANSVQDWVVIELRDKNNSSIVLATHSALMQRDGDIVGVDGSSDVSFNLPADDYYIAVRHRNHLGIMTMNAQALSNSATLKDLSDGSIALFGGTNATKLIGSKRCMYTGDASRNSVVAYSGSGNDRDLVLTRIGGTTPTNTVSGYYPEDLNLDGVVRYTGANNDRDLVLVNIGGIVPSNTRAAQLP